VRHGSITGQPASGLDEHGDDAADVGLALVPAPARERGYDDDDDDVTDGATHWWRRRRRRRPR
jgi:hypothetical protein